LLELSAINAFLFVSSSVRVSMPLPFHSRSEPAPPAFNTARPLNETDAIEIWIAKWLRVRRKDLITRYNCDPRRIYEIWEGVRFPRAREKALSEFSTRYPQLVGAVDPSHHKRLPVKSRSPDQLNLFG
jgi:hypothetical protein